MRKAVKIGFIGVFCAVIGLAFPVFNIFSKQLSMDSHENRLMTGLPGMVGLLVLLFLSLMRVTAGTYSAFIYFQF